MRWNARSVAASACLLVLTLTSCNQPAAPDAGNTAAADLPPLPASVPMQPGPATPLAAAPPAQSLPRAARLPLRRLATPRDGYAYLDRAASYDDAIGDAPPDYGFGYDGVTPWGWQADDGSTEYAEPVSGGYRYYYYQPGAPTPYLVRDPDYSYAYDGSSLVVVYDALGRMLSPGAYGPRWDYAGSYFARARDLREAALTNRQGVIAANWAARRAEVAASDASWDAARARDAAWSAYHSEAAEQQRAYWQAERERRAAASQSFVSYQSRGFAGPPAVLTPYPPRPSWTDRLRFWHRGQEDQRAQQAQADRTQAMGRQQQAAPREQWAAERQRAEAQRQQLGQVRLAGERQRLEQANEQKQQAELGRRQAEVLRQRHMRAEQQADRNQAVRLARTERQREDQRQDARRQAVALDRRQAEVGPQPAERQQQAPQRHEQQARQEQAQAWAHHEQAQAAVRTQAEHRADAQHQEHVRPQEAHPTHEPPRHDTGPGREHDHR